MKIETSKIKIEKRIREDLGDIASLAQNIKEYGQISPIRVRKINSNKFKLLAGPRRLEAVKLLHYDTIRVEIENE